MGFFFSSSSSFNCSIDPLLLLLLLCNTQQQQDDDDDDNEQQEEFFCFLFFYFIFVGQEKKSRNNQLQSPSLSLSLTHNTLNIGLIEINYIFFSIFYHYGIQWNFFFQRSIIKGDVFWCVSHYQLPDNGNRFLFC